MLFFHAGIKTRCGVYIQLVYITVSVVQITYFDPFQQYLSNRKQAILFITQKHKTMNTAKNILSQNCPRCRKGKLFVAKTYDLKNFNKMHDQCSVCAQRFELEPSFYFGAMYISYAQQVALFAIITVVISTLFAEADIIWYIISIAGFSLILFPFTFRLSRSIWIHLFVKYNAALRPDLQQSS